MAYPQPSHQHYGQGQNVENQEWQSSLCNCSPCSSCLLGSCCPCILLGKTSERLRDPSMQTAETVNGDCMIFCGIQTFLGCGWIHAMIRRGEIRQRFGIQGSGFSDCCTTYWCLCLALIQQDNEVKSRLAQGPVTQGYQSNKEGMTMPQPGQQQQQQQQQQHAQYDHQPQQSASQQQLHPQSEIVQSQPYYDPNQIQPKH